MVGYERLGEKQLTEDHGKEDHDVAVATQRWGYLFRVCRGQSQNQI